MKKLKCSILGLGLMGGSLVKALKEKGFYLSTVKREGENYSLIDKAYDSLGDMLKETDIVFLATPLSVIFPLAKEIASLAKDSDRSLVVIDIGSVKTQIAELFRSLSSEKVEFVATHPMAGLEKSGYEHSMASLFVDAPWVITPHDKNQESTLEQVENLIRLLGARPLRLTPSEHDEQAALVSHLPYLISVSLLNFVKKKDPASLKIAGPGFKSMTRLAADNPDLRAEIGKYNQERIQRLLKDWISDFEVNL